MVQHRQLLMVWFVLLLLHACQFVGSLQEQQQPQAHNDGDMTATNTATADNLYKSSTFVGHSLWLVPTPEASRVAYETILNETAAALGTLPFTPHVTLVAAIMTDVTDVVTRAQALSHALTSHDYQFQFQAVSHKDAYFQCVFATYVRTPAVLQANALARRYFPEKQSDPPYLPHLSLIYGNNISAEEKETHWIPTLTQRIVDGASDTTTFSVDAIEVWSTQGHVQEWYLVERIPLVGKKEQSSWTVSSSSTDTTTTTTTTTTESTPTATKRSFIYAKLVKVRQSIQRVLTKLWRRICSRLK
eukprot:scaffold1513_cov100-Amphora_coffeaeformis.AAC.27